MSAKMLCALLLSITLIGLGDLAAQSEYEYVESSEIVEMAVDFWVPKRPKRVRTVKFRLGEELSVNTWSSGRLKGQLEAIAGDSFNIAGTWVKVYDIEGVNGRSDIMESGLRTVLMGSAAAVASIGVAYLVVSGNDGMYTDLEVGIFVLAVNVLVYSVAIAGAGVIQLIGSGNLKLSSYSKQINLHTEAQMIDNMRKGERKRYLKRLASVPN